MANFSKWNAKQDPRTELHDVLGLTGAEISINNLPAGVGVPFVHSHSPTTHGTPSTFVISYVDKPEFSWYNYIIVPQKIKFHDRCTRV